MVVAGIKHTAVSVWWIGEDEMLKKILSIPLYAGLCVLLTIAIAALVSKPYRDVLVSPTQSLT